MMELLESGKVEYFITPTCTTTDWENHIVGRFLCDEANYDVVKIEASRIRFETLPCPPPSIRLNVNFTPDLPQTAIFPGLVCALKGNLMSSTTFEAKEVCSGSRCEFR